MVVELLKEGTEAGGLTWKAGDEEDKASMDIRRCRHRCRLPGIGSVWSVREFFLFKQVEFMFGDPGSVLDFGVEWSCCPLSFTEFT